MSGQSNSTITIGVASLMQPSNTIGKPPAEEASESLTEAKPPKWNSLLRNEPPSSEKHSSIPPPEAEPNQPSNSLLRCRSESAPEVVPPSPQIQTSLLLSPVDSDQLATLEKFGQKKAQIRLSCNPASVGSVLPALKSPCVAPACDWKVVGSPVVDGTGNSSDPVFRPRAMSLVEALTSTAMQASLLNPTLTNAPATSIDEHATVASAPASTPKKSIHAVLYPNRLEYHPISFDQASTLYQEERRAPESIGEDDPRDNNLVSSVASIGVAADSLSTSNRHRPEVFKHRLSYSTASIASASSDTSVHQIAQLPLTIHKDLGLSSTEEATEIFKRSSMDSALISASRSKNTNDHTAAPNPEGAGRVATSIFGGLLPNRMPFGPAAALFSSDMSDGRQPLSGERIEGFESGDEIGSSTGLALLNSSPASDDTGSNLSITNSTAVRRGSLFAGNADWGSDGVLKDLSSAIDHELTVDDYFLGASLPTFDKKALGFSGASGVVAPAASPSLTVRGRYPRRHSIAETTSPTDAKPSGITHPDHNGASNLSPFASVFRQSTNPINPSTTNTYSSRLSQSLRVGYGAGSSTALPNLLDYLQHSSTASNGLGPSAAAMSSHHTPGATSPSHISSAELSMGDAAASFQLSTYKGPLYAVEFKAGRTEIFYVLEVEGKPQFKSRVGDLVIVEADRGEDLGKITTEISVSRLKQLMVPSEKGDIANSGGSNFPPSDASSDILTPELASLLHTKEIIPKRIHRLAQPSDLKLLQAKAQEEALAMVRCQSRIRQKKLPMEVVDAEYQWDRNKLTFYFCADRRIDFRELVRDLFRIYKTRIWMCAVDKASPRMLLYSSPNGSGPLTIALGPALPTEPISPVTISTVHYLGIDQQDYEGDL